MDEPIEALHKVVASQPVDPTSTRWLKEAPDSGDHAGDNADPSRSADSTVTFLVVSPCHRPHDAARWAPPQPSLPDLALPAPSGDSVVRSSSHGVRLDDTDLPQASQRILRSKLAMKPRERAHEAGRGKARELGGANLGRMDGRLLVVVRESGVKC